MRFVKFLNENDDDLMATLSDFIEMYIENGDKEKEEKYRKIYKEKFGKEYKSIESFLPTPSLDFIYSKKDFDRYQDYIKYSDDLFKLKFNTYKSKIKNIPNPYVDYKKAMDFYNLLGIEMTFGNVKGTEEAYVGSDDKVVFKPKYQNIKIPKEIIIHELGHILDNKKNIISGKSDLFLHNRKTSVYDFSPVEIFAESFLNYVTQPEFLKAGWMDVYNYFNKNVPSKWKTIIKKFINN